MGLIGSIAGGVLGAGASIFGGISASKAIKRMKKNIENQMRDNQNWYDRRYNEDSTQRADAQRLLTMTQDSIRNRNRQSAGSAAVMGGTDESVAATKAINNDALANTVSQINAQGDARKDRIESQYMGTKSNLTNQLNALEQNKAQAISQAAQGVAKAGSEMVDLF